MRHQWNAIVEQRAFHLAHGIGIIGAVQERLQASASLAVSMESSLRYDISL